MKRKAVLIFLILLSLSLGLMGLHTTGSNRFNSDPTNGSLSNNATEVTMLSYTIPAGTLSTGHTVEMDVLTYVTSSATPPTLTIRGKYGTCTTTFASAQIGTSLTNAPIRLILRVIGDGATGTQVLHGMAMQGPALANNINTSLALCAIDSTVSQALAISVQFGALDAGTTLTLTHNTTRDIP